MKVKLIFSFIFLISLSMITLLIFANDKNHIVSWFVMDIDNDSKDELMVITKKRTFGIAALDSGEKYGDSLRIYNDFETTDTYPKLTGVPVKVFNLAEIKPLKVQAGDINGDGKNEIAICVYKTAEFHPVYAKRPFFYGLEDNELKPVWLGSRLARPFVDYVLFDIDYDGIQEIISIELLENGDRVIAAYDWKGFGFEVKALSESIKEEVYFGDINRQINELFLYTSVEKYMIVIENDVLLFQK